MPTPKHTEPVVLIIVTSIVLYGIIRSKKLHYLGRNWRHHIITPSMKAGKMKTVMDRELKRSIEH